MAPDMQNRKTLELRYPRFSYVFAPLIAAVEQRDSAEPGRSDAASSVLRSADIVTNASNLRKLLHLLTGRKYLCERYDIELVAGPDGAANDTLFLSKWTDDPSLHTSMGHGAGFERATCRYPQGHGGDEARLLRRSVSHHRVVAYSLGGLRMVVQSEVDAYHCDCASHCSPSKATTPLPTPPSSPKMAKAAAVVASASSSTARRHPSKTTATTHTTGQTHPKHRPAAAPDSFEVAGSSKRRGPRSGNNGTSVSNHGSIGSSTRVVSPPPPKTGSGRQRNSFGALTVDDPGDTAAFKARAQEDDSPLLTPPPSPTQPRCPTFTPLPKTENAVSTADFGGLRVHHVPSTAIIPAKCLLEVKTRDARYNPLFPPEAQLYFSRMARLFEATHLRGVFDVPLSSRTSLPTVAAAIPFSGIRPLPGFEHLPHQLAARPSQPQRRSTAPPATTSSWSPKQSWTRSDPGWQRTTSDLNLTNTSPSSYATGEIQDMTTHLRCWEFENQEPLARLVALLGKVVEAARARLRGARRDAAAESNTPRSVKLALICEHVRDAQEGGSAPPHSGGHVVVSLWDRPSGKALVPPHSLSTAAANDSKCRGRQKHQQQWQQQQQTVIR